MDKQKAYQILRGFVDGVIPAKYKKAVVYWLISDKDVDVKDAALQEIWKETDIDIDNSFQQSLECFRRNRKNLILKNRRSMVIRCIMRYAAIFLLTFMVGIAVWSITFNYYNKSNKMLECYVPNRKMKAIVLSDGTMVSINSGSILLYPKDFTGNTRQVYLSGEANFHVKKDAKHPFIVRVGQLNIQVLGTRFNVEAYSENDNVTTTLEEGSVKLFDSETNKALCVLKPNEQAIFNRQKREYTRYVVDAINYSSWTHGDLNFDKQSLDEIISILEHRFDVNFLIDHALDMSKEYTIKFKSYEKIDDILKVLSTLSGDILYKKEGRIIKLYMSRKEVEK